MIELEKVSKELFGRLSPESKKKLHEIIWRNYELEVISGGKEDDSNKTR